MKKSFRINTDQEYKMMVERNNDYRVMVAIVKLTYFPDFRQDFNRVLSEILEKGHFVVDLYFGEDFRMGIGSVLLGKPSMTLHPKPGINYNENLKTILTV